MVFLCFDFGTLSWGCAVGDDLTGIVTPIEALKAEKGVPDWEEVQKRIDDWGVEAFVIGYPLKASGERFKLTDQVDLAIVSIKKRFSSIELHTADERLSTVEARENIFQNKGFKGLNKGMVDSESAKIILENWFSNVRGI